MVTRNGFAIAGFVLGLLGLLLSAIPVVGVVAWPLVVTGLVAATIALRRAIRNEAPNKGLAVAGLTFSAMGLFVCVVWVAGTVNGMNNPADEVTEVHYAATGTARDATITYSAFGDNGSATNQESATLPWSKDVHIEGLLKGSSLTIATGSNGGDVTCAVIVNGKETRTSKASGPFAIASCDGF